MTRLGLTCTALALALATPGYALAQDAQQTQGTDRGGQQLAQQDQQFVEQAAMSNMEEIEAGQLAIERAQSTEVQDHGRRMVEDHTVAQEELRALAEQAGAELPQELDQHHREKLDQLRSAKGRQFDSQYVQAQVEGHQTAIEHFTHQVEQGENPDLRSYAKSTLPTLEEHLQGAENLQQIVSTGEMTAGGQARQPSAGAAPGNEAQVSTAPGGAPGTGEAGKDAQGAQAALGTESDTAEAGGMISMEQFMGKAVVGADGQELGDVSDIVLDPQTGEAQQLVISSGGFLGIGEKQIAVPFDQAQIAPENDVVTVSSITQQDVEAMEEFVRAEGMTTYSQQDEAAQPPAQ